MPQLGLVPAVSYSNENGRLHMTELQCPTERHCFTATHRRFVPQTPSYHYVLVKYHPLHATTPLRTTRL